MIMRIAIMKLLNLNAYNNKNTNHDYTHLFLLVIVVILHICHYTKQPTTILKVAQNEYVRGFPYTVVI